MFLLLNHKKGLFLKYCEWKEMILYIIITHKHQYLYFLFPGFLILNNSKGDIAEGRDEGGTGVNQEHEKE